MTPRELLRDVQALGVQIRVDGEYLRLRPKAALTEELLRELRKQKSELLGLLTPSLSQALGGVVEAEPSLCQDDVCAMSLEEFAQAGLVLTVRSDALRDVVLFASDNATLDPGEKRVVYRSAELSELVGLGFEALESVHRSKKLFGGTVLAS